MEQYATAGDGDPVYRVEYTGYDDTQPEQQHYTQYDGSQQQYDGQQQAQAHDYAAQLPQHEAQSYANDPIYEADNIAQPINDGTTEHQQPYTDPSQEYDQQQQQQPYAAYDGQQWNTDDYNVGAAIEPPTPSAVADGSIDFSSAQRPQDGGSTTAAAAEPSAYIGAGDDTIEQSDT